MASNYRCPVCHQPYDMEPSLLPAVMTHLLKHSVSRGLSMEWVNKEVDKAKACIDDNEK